MKIQRIALASVSVGFVLLLGVLLLRDQNGTIRVKLGASESGSGLLLANERTEPGAQILAGRTGTLLSLHLRRTCKAQWMERYYSVLRLVYISVYNQMTSSAYKE